MFGISLYCIIVTDTTRQSLSLIIINISTSRLRRTHSLTHPINRRHMNRDERKMAHICLCVWNGPQRENRLCKLWNVVRLIDTHPNTFTHENTHTKSSQQRVRVESSGWSKFKWHLRFDKHLWPANSSISRFDSSPRSQAALSLSLSLKPLFL